MAVHEVERRSYRERGITIPERTSPRPHRAVSRPPLPVKAAAAAACAQQLQQLREEEVGGSLVEIELSAEATLEVGSAVVLTAPAGASCRWSRYACRACASSARGSVCGGT